MNGLNELLTKIGEEYGELISDTGRNYLEVDIGKHARRYGYPDVAEKFGGTVVIVPLKKPVSGMKVRIDGRTFVNYGQLVSGVAGPGYLVTQSGHPYRAFIPKDSMILNCV